MQYNPRLTHKKCCNMDDIYLEIDQMDHAVIKLLATHFEYVKAASELKKSANDIQAKSRFNSILGQRKLVGKLVRNKWRYYRRFNANLVRYFIDEELKQFNNKVK